MDAPQRASVEDTSGSVAIRGLMVASTVAFALASLVHSGVTIGLGTVEISDPFPGAKIPEAIIAVALGIGAISLFARWPGSRWVALGTTLFALLLTIYGLTVTALSSRTGDVVYHVAILAMLAAIVKLLLRP